MIAKTTTERVQALRKRRDEAGLAEVRGIFAHPEDHVVIKAYAAKLARKRLKASRATD